ncbi:MAG: UDP-N-acetylmuramoyl-tripeptide--D-alanyl-D-alanine ligase [Anaerolineae bacterium]|nr:UDP-N-acetylmuramoyl-tripeptide--D-alanyl-D-alanine ligase [Anaerolineae bacterium]
MLTLQEVWEGLTGASMADERLSSVKFSKVVIDSRLADEHSLFVALKGEHDDGHNYVNAALQQGASAAIIERAIEGAPQPIDIAKSPGAPPHTLTPPFCLLVENTLEALQDISAHYRRQFDVRVIGVTGSVGKSTTKEAIHSVLSRGYVTLKSQESYNNETGLPLTLLQLNEGHQRLVVELGMYALGEIRHLASLALPSVGVVTNVEPSHLERLGSLERIAEAKAELVQALPPDGTAILNGDDPMVRSMADLTPATAFCYGLEPGNDLWASHIESRGLDGVRFRLHYGRETLHVKIPLLGRHSVHTALAAAAVGLVEGLPWGQIVAGLRHIEVQLRLIATPGIKGTTIIDDSYNASPASSLAALNLLAELKGRKIAVLGDMLELGSYQEEGHRKVGRRAAEVVDKLVTVGELGAAIGQEAITLGMEEADVLFAEDNQQAIDLLSGLLEPGDIVLIKGSRAMHMEDIVAQVGERQWPLPSR